MSLEAAILENTATLRELIERLTNTSLAAPVHIEGKANVVVSPKAEDLPVTKKKDPAKPVTEEKAVEAKGTVTVEDEPATYEDVKKLILELSKVKGSKVAVTVLGMSGASKGPELKPEKFAEFVANARKELGVA